MRRWTLSWGESQTSSARVPIRLSSVESEMTRTWIPAFLQRLQERSDSASRRLILSGIVVALPLFVSCGSVEDIPANGIFHGHPISTTVDSPVAKYYLEQYLQEEHGDPELERQIRGVHDNLGGEIPNRRQLKEISEDFQSVDLAAMVFGHQLLSLPRNQDVQRVFMEYFSLLKKGSYRFEDRSPLIVLVPGFDYVQAGEATGADLAKPRDLIEDHGFDVRFVEIEPTGTVESSALRIQQVLAAHSDRHIFIAGPSSAGPAIHLALSEAKDTSMVKVWINLGGVLQGTPIVDYLDSGIAKPLFQAIVWWKGWNLEGFRSLKTGISRTRFAQARLPAHILVINYLGLSLSVDVSDFAWYQYRMMRSLGPNDGLTFLPDALIPSGFTILAPRSDHFFAEDPDIHIKTLSILRTAQDLLLRM